MVGYAASLIPTESFFSASNQSLPPASVSPSLQASAGKCLSNSAHQKLEEQPKVYAIRDVDYICSMTINSYSVVIGEDAYISLNFANSKQMCSAVRSILMLSEQRADGTTIQVTKTLTQTSIIELAC